MATRNDVQARRGVAVVLLVNDAAAVATLALRRDAVARARDHSRTGNVNGAAVAAHAAGATRAATATTIAAIAAFAAVAARATVPAPTTRAAVATKAGDKDAFSSGTYRSRSINRDEPGQGAGSAIATNATCCASALVRACVTAITAVATRPTG